MAAVVLLLSEFRQHVGRIPIAGISQAAQLVQVPAFARQLDKLIDRVRAAAICQAAQLVQVPAFARQFDELVYGVLVSVCGPRSQVRQLVVTHRYLPLLAAFGTV
jgi:hypothetical protein